LVSRLLHIVWDNSVLGLTEGKSERLAEGGLNRR
jgi:hypothetical protein